MKNKQSMYSLGTTLILDLTNASAAADLFGKEHLKSYGRIIGWEHGFVVAACSVYSGGDAEISEKWELVLDTEEKLSWFTAQVGDDIRCKKLGTTRIESFYYSDTTDTLRIQAEKGLTDFSNIERIILRNNKPFPHSRDVK